MEPLTPNSGKERMNFLQPITGLQALTYASSVRRTPYGNENENQWKSSTEGFLLAPSGTMEFKTTDGSTVNTTS